MRRRDSGFTILEMMIGLAIVMLVLAAATTFFIGVVRQYKVQTKIVETNVEGVLGLELFRQDLESLGFGLPFAYPPSSTYADSEPGDITLKDAPTAPPRAVASIDSSSAPDYLVIKSARVGMNTAAGKWTTLRSGGSTRHWGSQEEDLSSGDYVIVVSPGTDSRTLLTPPGTIFSDVDNVVDYAPDNTSSPNIVYGIDNAGLLLPFNRADYSVVTTSVPRHCAPNTGVLVKRVATQDAVGYSTPYPLLDCVMDMQVAFGFDTNGDKQVEDWENAIPAATFNAEKIRKQLSEVRVYILAQEGQRDDAYKTPSDTIRVGFVDPTGTLRGRDVDVSGYRNYRWKVYTIVVKPRNLAN